MENELKHDDYCNFYEPSRFFFFFLCFSFFNFSSNKTRFCSASLFFMVFFFSHLDFFVFKGFKSICLLIHFIHCASFSFEYATLLEYSCRTFYLGFWFFDLGMSAFVYLWKCCVLRVTYLKWKVFHKNWTETMVKQIWLFDDFDSTRIPTVFSRI